MSLCESLCISFVHLDSAIFPPFFSCPLLKWIHSREGLRLSAVDSKSKSLYKGHGKIKNQSAVTVVVFKSWTTESKVKVDQMRSQSGPDQL